MSKKAKMTAALLRSLFTYDDERKMFRWRVDSPKHRACVGNVAGNREALGFEGYHYNVPKLVALYEMADETHYDQVPARFQPVELASPHDLTAKLLRELLTYHPEEGKFRWRIERRRGMRPGCVAGNGKHVRIDGIAFPIKQLVALYSQPDETSYDYRSRKWVRRRTIRKPNVSRPRLPPPRFIAPMIIGRPTPDPIVPKPATRLNDDSLSPREKLMWAHLKRQGMSDKQIRETVERKHLALVAAFSDRDLEDEHTDY